MKLPKKQKRNFRCNNYRATQRSALCRNDISQPIIIICHLSPSLNPSSSQYSPLGVESTFVIILYKLPNTFKFEASVIHFFFFIFLFHCIGNLTTTSLSALVGSSLTFKYANMNLSRGVCLILLLTDRTITRPLIQISAQLKPLMRRALDEALMGPKLEKSGETLIKGIGSSNRRIDKLGPASKSIVDLPSRTPKAERYLDPCPENAVSHSGKVVLIRRGCARLLGSGFISTGGGFKRAGERLHKFDNFYSGLTGRQKLAWWGRKTQNGANKVAVVLILPVALVLKALAKIAQVSGKAAVKAGKLGIAGGKATVRGGVYTAKQTAKAAVVGGKFLGGVIGLGVYSVFWTGKKAGQGIWAFVQLIHRVLWHFSRAVGKGIAATGRGLQRVGDGVQNQAAKRLHKPVTAFRRKAR
ncbi:hypothetical protein O181_028623 [Austropuccinia psidii MF-1]|uniref:Uncharacterized protein n=1 Tax=Austropuccinia psidii MF-1 TaxID=1389203 RepID=A0A9Q3CU61_9BASI|nr:hypothetical protein [Austropuccinia psidii MF-1]